MDIPLDDLRARRGLKWNKYDADVLPAWVADMDYRLSPAVADVLDRAAADHDLGYALRDGARAEGSLAAAFSARMARRFGWAPDPALTLPCTELVQALNACVWAFAGPGDGVVVQTPCYPPIREAVTGLGRTFVADALVDTPEGYRLDLDTLRAHLDETVKVIVVCNPHNPTGRVLTRAELEGIAAVAKEHGLVVVSDEIHVDFVHDGEHIPFATVDAELAPRVVTITAPTKTYNIAAMRCAVMSFGSAELLAEFNRAVPTKVLGGLNIIGVDTGVAAWRDSDEWEQGLLARLRANRDTVMAAVRGWPGVRAHPPEGTYLAWLDCSGLALRDRTAGEFFLDEARVALNPGQDFDAGHEHFCRLNFATSPEVLAQVLERMGAAVQSAAIVAGAA